MKLNKVTSSGQGLDQPEASQNDILINYKSEPRIDSRVISERAGIQHQSLGATIKSHHDKFRELGALPRQSLKELPDLNREKPVANVGVPRSAIC